jgi:glycosyltransferase involved in cell wall biosynthesis
MKIGLYNRHLATLGGGERYSLAIAAELSRNHAVEVISHTPVSRAGIAARLELPLADVTLRVVPEQPSAELGWLTAEYDFFINASNGDFVVPYSPYSALVVYFPASPNDGPAARLRQRLGQALAEGFLLPHWQAGVYGEENGGIRRLAPNAAVTLPPGAGGSIVRFQLRSAVDARQHVTLAVDGQTQATLDVGAHAVPCRVVLPDSSNGPHTVTITAEALALDAPFALELAGWQVDNLRNEIYRRWFVPYLPGWDTRLRNPQPEDITAVAGTYRLIWAISQFTQRWIDRYWQLPSQLLYPPVDVPRFAVPAESAGKQPRILSVGRFFAGQHNKQHLTMVRAFRRLVDEGLQGWQLQLAGGLQPGTEHAAYLAEVRNAAVGYPIHIHADLPFDRLVELYRSSAIYWHAAGFGEDEEQQPIKAEHFGITTVEAMAAGCVPVVIARGGQPELIDVGVDGFLWSTVEELLATTRLLIADQALCRQMGQAAAAASRRFDMAHFATGLQATLAAAAIPASPE